VIVVCGIGGDETGVFLLDTQTWAWPPCEEHGNVLAGLELFAFVPAPRGFILFGGTEPTGRIPWPCAWILNVDTRLAAGRSRAPPRQSVTLASAPEAIAAASDGPRRWRTRANRSTPPRFHARPRRRRRPRGARRR
jgi:hypothetical protein